MLRPINPGLFTRLMCLPDAARADLLECLGATPLADTQLSSMIDAMAEKVMQERRAGRYEPN